MMKCKKLKKDFVAFLYGELPESQKELLQTHIDSCPQCEKELEQLRDVIKGADALQEGMDNVMSSIDWEILPHQISENVFERRAYSHRKFWFTKIFQPFVQPKWRPVYVGLLLGILLGSVVTFMILRYPFPKEGEEKLFLVPQDFLEKVELEMARRETLDFLEKSEYLLLDLVNSPTQRTRELWQSEFASRRAKDLLTKKRYINPQLDKYQMAKAKATCNQIEFLFYELTHISVHLSKEELNKIQKMIEERQILLKIKLLKEELEHSEV